MRSRTAGPRLAAALIALVMAVFVLAPAAAAATCASVPSQASTHCADMTTVDDHSGTPSHGDPTRDHDGCSHTHCHAAPSLPAMPVLDLAASPRLRTANLTAGPAAPLASLAPTGPEPPPKA